MSARTVAALSLALVNGVLASPGQVFRSSTDAVTVDVSVRLAGKLVSGLTASDFQLFDNGVAQRIDVVTSESLPMDMTILLDVSGSVAGSRLVELKQAVIDMARLLRREDRVRLLAVSHHVREVFGFRPGGALAASALDGLAAGGNTSLYDSLILTLLEARPSDRRHLIVLCTDGADTLSFLGASVARDVALESDAVLHFIVSQPRAGAPPADVRHLADLADATGGAVLFVDSVSTVPSAFKRVLDDFRMSYVLHYVSQGVPRPGWHVLKVNVARVGRYEIRARAGYFGG